MTILEQLIKHYESLHDGDLTKIGLQPKMDCSGIWTEGWGHAMRLNGKFIKGYENKELAYKNQTIHTIEDADAAFIVDIKPFQLQVARKIHIDLNESQESALVSLFYNCGSSSTICDMVNRNDKNIYNWWINHYITSGGVVQKGLIYRRKTEALLFTTGNLKYFN